MSFFVDHRPLWLAGTNTWVVAAEVPGPAVIIDAPPDPAGIEGLLRRHELAPVALLVTHGHIDHVGGAGAVAPSLVSTAYLHPDDEWLATDPGSQLRAIMGVALGAERLVDFAPPERFDPLADGQKLALAGVDIEVLHTPGHTPGHCCFLVAREGVLFSGDQLFAGSIGRTDLPGGDYDTLMASMRDKVITLDPETQVLPGHGPATTLARELAYNPFLQGL
jgi:glyoxylase-like metal-dependent hydrolase (beta-lactamase superfamily II)